MPYITWALRNQLESGVKQPCEPGELNYIITKLLISNPPGLVKQIEEAVNNYIARVGPRYSTYNEVAGAVFCATAEFVRRDSALTIPIYVLWARFHLVRDWLSGFYINVVAPYEDKKILENGDVYPDN